MFFNYPNGWDFAVTLNGLEIVLESLFTVYLLGIIRGILQEIYVQRNGQQK